MKKIENWENDSLNRKEEGQFLIDYLLKRYELNKETSFVLNLNAEWGFGKTYFLENIALELEGKNHPVIYFDAWKNDYSKDPLLAFLSEVDNALKKYFENDSKAYKTFKTAFKSIAPKILSSISKKIIGVALDELDEVIEDDKLSTIIDENSADIEKNVSSLVLKSAEKALKNHQLIKKSISSFKINMKKLLDIIDEDKETNIPLFILIDELDRCRPSYAIELLETIKHLFDIQNIIFIVATDSKQLSYAVNAIYGNDFESQRYLKRFFDQEYTLRVPNSYEYSYSLFEKYKLLDNDLLYSSIEKEFYKDKNLEVQLFSLYADYFKLVPRDINQVMIVLSAIVLTWESKTKIHLGYLLFLIMLKQKDDELFDKYTKQGSEILNDKDIFQKEINIHTKRNQSKGTHSFSWRNYDVSIASLITEYIKISNDSDESLYKKSSKIYLIEELYYVMHSTLNDKTSIQKKLQTYPEMVLRSGQFTI
jgi:hypothetical protein